MATKKKSSKNFIQKAIKHPGALTASAKKAGMSPMAFAKKQANNPEADPTTRKRAQFALELQSFNKGKKKKGSK